MADTTFGRMDFMTGIPFRGVVCQNKETENKMSEYIVWNPASHLPTKVVHENRQTAIKVAGRMAHKSPGATFYVCKLTNSATKPIPVDVKYVDLDKGDAPF